MNLKIFILKLFVFSFVFFTSSFFCFSKTSKEWIEQGINENKPGNKILAFNEAVKSAQNDSKLLSISYYNRGIVYYEMKDFDKAVSDFMEALKIYPDSIDYLKNAGLTYLILRKYDESIKCFEKIISLEPDSSLGYFLRGNAYLERKVYSAAIRDYNHILLKDQYHVDARNNRGWAYIFMKKYSKALEDFDRVLAIRPNDEYALEGKKKLLKILDKS